MLCLEDVKIMFVLNSCQAFCIFNRYKIKLYLSITYIICANKLLIKKGKKKINLFFLMPQYIVSALKVKFLKTL